MGVYVQFHRWGYMYNFNNILAAFSHRLLKNMQQWQYWDEISLFILLMIFPYFLAFLLIFMNTQIMQI